MVYCDVMELLTTVEASSELNLSRERLLKYISDGRLKAIKKGKTWLILRDDLESFKAMPRQKAGRPKSSI